MIQNLATEMAQQAPLQAQSIEDFLTRIQGQYCLQDHIDGRDQTEQHFKTWRLNPNNQNIPADFDYRNDSWGFRQGNEWAWDLVCLGCSVTYGVGVPQSHSWPQLVARAGSRSVTNLAISGASMSMIQTLFAGVIRWGRPREVVVFLPDYSRELLSYRSTSGAVKNFFGFANWPMVWDQEPQVTICKHYYSLPDEYWVRRCADQVQQMALLAEVTGVRTLFGTWSGATYRILEHMGLDSFDHCSLLAAQITPDQEGRDGYHPGVAYHQRLAQAISSQLGPAASTQNSR